MRSLKMCCVSPHAPILVPEVGGSELRKASRTSAAMDLLAGEIAAVDPDTIVLIYPPHLNPVSLKAFPVKNGKRFAGSWSSAHARFSFEADVDRVLVDAIAEAARNARVELFYDERSSEEDWGALVPLYLLATPRCSLVSITALPYLSMDDHFRLGLAVRDAVEIAGRAVVFVASGDMSHHLQGSHYGFHPGGPVLDKAVVDAVNSGDFSEIFRLDARLVEDAGQDCLWSLATLAGVIDGYGVESEVLSYEGPFGIGYMVARVLPADGAPETELAQE